MVIDTALYALRSTWYVCSYLSMPGLELGASSVRGLLLGWYANLPACLSIWLGRDFSFLGEDGLFSPNWTGLVGLSVNYTLPHLSGDVSERFSFQKVATRTELLEAWTNLSQTISFGCRRSPAGNILVTDWPTSSSSTSRRHRMRGAHLCSFPGSKNDGVAMTVGGLEDSITNKPLALRCEKTIDCIRNAWSQLNVSAVIFQKKKKKKKENTKKVKTKKKNS